MRQVARHSLPQRTLNYLARKQADIDSGRDVDTIWKNARRTKTMVGVARTLELMSGRRQRCMFCGDSRSTDIEHFWPKARYRPRVFRWDNMLWICTGCNRHKGHRFLLDRRGRPLLINPTAEDPWDSLFFDASTGNITAKYDTSTGQMNPKGAHTVDPTILPLNIEAVTEGRQRTYRNLVRTVRAYITRMETGPHLANPEADLIEGIRDNDDYGLAYWYFRRDGWSEEPFRTLRDSFLSVWERIAQSL